MVFIPVFFSEYVGDVVTSWNVVKIDEFTLYIFSDGVVAELDMSNGTCCLVLAP